MNSERFTVTIDRWGPSAAGVGFKNGRSFLVPGSIPGETVDIECVPDGTNRPLCRILQIRDPSPFRVPSQCDQAPFCPGCRLRHLSASDRLDWLKRQVTRILTGDFPEIKIPGITVHSHPAPEEYRLKATAAVINSDQNSILGMPPYPWSIEAVDLTRCPNHDPKLNELLSFTAKFIRQSDVPEPVRQSLRWVLAHLSADGRHRLTFVISRQDLMRPTSDALSKFPGISGLSLHLSVSAPPSQSTEIYEPAVISGNLSILFRSASGLFTALPGAWTPVSEGTTEIVTEYLHEKINSIPGHILEIGCGIGLQSIPLAVSGRSVHGIDTNRSAIESARINTCLAVKNPPSFHLGDARKQLRKIASAGIIAGTVILHGMRRPFPPGLFDELSLLKAQQVLLLSPSIRSFSRNASDLLARSWRLRTIDLFDQIPFTARALTAGEYCRNQAS